MKRITTGLAVAASALLLSSPAMAFHSGGVAECEGCHTMHNSYEGQAQNTALGQFKTGPYLLKGSDQSSTCLNCHEASGATSYHISTPPADMATAGQPPVNMTPGGDFGWLRKSYTWSPRTGSTENSPGERHGHNIVAADFSFVPDSKITTAPGGNFPAANLACNSCHDPHGKYRRDATGAVSQSGLPIANSGSYSNSAAPAAGATAVGAYRILGGAGYKSRGAVDAFANEVPAAVSPSTYNQSEDTNQVRVAYGKGMSEWCANCHGSIHNDTLTAAGTGTITRHPAGNAAKLTNVAATYNSYVKSGDLSGTQASSFNSLVPFETGSSDYAALAALASNNKATDAGPDATANVSCLSCHRAHASGFDSMTRFGLGIEYFTVANADGTNVRYGDPAVSAERKVAMGRSIAEQQAALHGRSATKFAPFQRALCNKCHAKD